MTTHPPSPFPAARAGRVSSARALADAAEATIVDLEQRLPLGMGPLEQALAARIRVALGRLLECAEQLAGDDLMIVGSMGQQRPHPLLKTEQDLRREVSDGLKDLTFRADQRATHERLKRLTGSGAAANENEPLT